MATDVRPSTSAISDAVPVELNSVRLRIDQNVENQRRHKEVIAVLQEKIAKYRQKATEMEAMLAKPEALPELSIADSRFYAELAPSTSFGEPFRAAPDGRSPFPSHSGKPQISSYRDPGGFSTDFVIDQLREEQIRNDTLEEINDMLRQQAETAITANQSLHGDISSLREKYKQLEADRDNEREAMRRHDQKSRATLNAQHAHMLELWIAFNRLKRQMKDLRTTTENDLDKQKTEFVKCANSLEKAVRQSDAKRSSSLSKKDTQRDAEVDDLLRKYEEIAMKNVQCEHEQSVKQRRISQLESELRRTQDKYDEMQTALHRICALPELGDGLGRRARSASPARPLGSYDAIRHVRNAMHAKNDDLRALQRQNESAEQKMAALNERIASAEEAKRKCEREQGDSRRSLKEMQHQRDELERQCKRLTDRINHLEQERLDNQTSIVKLQEQIVGLQNLQHSMSNESVKLHRNEMDELRLQNSSEKQAIEADFQSRIEKLRTEIEKQKHECTIHRDQLRTLQSQASGDQRKHEALESQLIEIQQRERRLLEDLEASQQKVHSKEHALVEKERQVEDGNAKLAATQSTIAALQNDRETVSAENSKLKECLLPLRAQLAELTAQVEVHEQRDQDHAHDVQELKSKIDDLQLALTASKRSMTDLEVKLESTTDQLRASQAEARTLSEEKHQNAEIAIRMNQEKSDLLRLRDTTEDELKTAKQLVEQLQGQVESLEQLVKDYRKQDAIDREKIEELTLTGQKLSTEKSELAAELKLLREKISEKERREEEELDKVAKEMEQLEQNYRKQQEIHMDEAKEMVEEMNKDKAVADEQMSEIRKKLNSAEETVERLQIELAERKQDLNALRENHDLEMLKAREHAAMLVEQHHQELDDLDQRRIKLVSEHEEIATELRNRLRDMEQSAKQRQETEQTLQSEVEDLHRKLTEDALLRTQLATDLDRREDELHALTAKYDAERQLLSQKLETAETTVRQANADRDMLSSKIDEMQKTMLDMEQKIAQKSERLTEIINDLEEVRRKLQDKEDEDVFAKDRLLDMERELRHAIQQRDQLQTSFVEAQRDAAEYKHLTSTLKNELALLQVKLTEDDHLFNTRVAELERLRAEQKSLEKLLSDRSAEIMALGKQVDQYESKYKIITKELEQEKLKVTQAESLTKSTQSDNDLLKRELAILAETLEKKTASHRTAVDELIDNYRFAEQAKSEASRQIETLKNELHALRAGLEVIERRHKESEQQLANSEAARSKLQDRVIQFENGARKALSFARAHSAVRGSSMALDANQDRLDGFFHLRGSSSSHDLSSNRRQPVDSNELPSTSLDMTAAVEVTFRLLREQIDQLEKEKSECKIELHKLKSDSESANSGIKSAVKALQAEQKRTNELVEEKKTLVARLASSRQLLVSQEETMRSRDQDLRSLKSRLIKAELHAREKDSRIQQLNVRKVTNCLSTHNNFLFSDQQKSQAAELSHIEAQLRRTRESESAAIEERVCLEQDSTKAIEDMRKLQAQQKKDKDVLESRIRDMQSQLEAAQKHSGQLEQKLQEQYAIIDRLQSNESVWKTRMDTLKQSSVESGVHEQRVQKMQTDLNDANAHARQADRIIETLRKELSDCKSHGAVLTSKITELKEKINDLTADNKRSQERLTIVEKVERDQRALIDELRRELELLRSERTKAIGEIDELKRRLHRVDVEKKELDAQRARLDRERAALKKHVDTLEQDRQQTDAAVRQTANERHALDKSLSALEKENIELYRSCSQLQSQVCQMEKENGNKLIELSNKQRQHLETQLARVKAEKKNLEYTINQREQEFSHKRKMLESQIAFLRDQLDAERKRRRDYVDRSTSQHDLRYGQSVDLQRRASPSGVVRMSRQSPDRQSLNLPGRGMGTFIRDKPSRT